MLSRLDTTITPQRIRVYGMLCVLLTCATILFLFATSNGTLDHLSRPIGTDFAGVWTAGLLTREGDAAGVFDIAVHATAQRAQFGADTPIYGWHYPPVFLLVAEPLSHLPYVAALIIYQCITLLLYLVAMHTILTSLPWRQWLWPVLGFGAVWVNLMHGHNGLLTAALFAGGLALLHSRTVLAGILLGVLCYKPQFGLLIPFALMAGGYWRAFTAAAFSVAALIALSVLCYGTDAWQAFFSFSLFTQREVLEAGSTGFYKIQTLFSAVRMWGASVTLAYAAQAALALYILFTLIRAWHARIAFAHKAALLLVGTLLATPYALDYDLMLLAPAIALLAVYALHHGTVRHEPSLLAAVWCMPFFARPVAQHSAMPLGLLLMLMLFVFTARRAHAAARLSTSLPPA